MNVDTTLRLLRQVDRLEALPRTGWVVSRVPSPETVAAHSYGVAMTAMVLSDLVGSRPTPPKLDRARVLEMALLHDLGEAITTDIPAPAKRFLGQQLLRDGERRAMTHLVEGLDERYMRLYDEYVLAESIEARIVHAADKVQLFMKANQYHAAGFTGVDRFWENTSSTDDSGLPEARVLLDRLAEHHAHGTWPIGDDR